MSTLMIFYDFCMLKFIFSSLSVYYSWGYVSVSYTFCSRREGIENRRKKRNRERQKQYSEARVCAKGCDSLIFSSSEMFFTPSHQHARITELNTHVSDE